MAAERGAEGFGLGVRNVGGGAARGGGRGAAFKLVAPHLRELDGPDAKGGQGDAAWRVTTGFAASDGVFTGGDQDCCAQQGRAGDGPAGRVGRALVRPGPRAKGGEQYEDDGDSDERGF